MFHVDSSFHATNIFFFQNNNVRNVIQSNIFKLTVFNRCENMIGKERERERAIRVKKKTGATEKNIKSRTSWNTETNAERENTN